MCGGGGGGGGEGGGLCMLVSISDYSTELPSHTVDVYMEGGAEIGCGLYIHACVYF